MKVEEARLPDQIVLWNRRLQGKKCEPITAFDSSLEKLVERMRKSCYYAKGVGLSACQIGEFVRAAVIHWPLDQPAWPIINPVIDEINSKGEQVQYEACLSIPTAQKVNVRVRRCRNIIYSYQTITGSKVEAEAEGDLARVIQHEVDHMSGIFYIDRISDLTRDLVLRSHQNWLSKYGPRRP